ncbi:MAG: hypothetical protein IJ409_10545 [Lachnospiraceae bacterium]|nr:hypothetical protein [Lachnospiraceae bacterium]MBQ8598215.1 hypothetical protein [Lachnospiraceae bacterium]
MKKNMLTIILTVILVFISAFCISGTVISQERGKSKVEEKYYRQAEQAYVKEVRSFLNEQGYKNSGVTMTYILAEDGSREYTVTIHHKKINALDESGKYRLMEACRQIVFPVEDCSFFHEFLEADL